VPDVNMKAYMEARALTQEFMDDFLGYYIPQRNRMLNSLLIGPGLPGGMMGSLMSDLVNNLQSINKWLTKNNKPNITQDDLLVQLFDEVEYIWPKLGYPPLVTPYSQYVKNVAMMNVMSMIKGKDRFSMIDDNTWDMLVGKAGKLPGELAPEILALAKKQGREFFTGNPQDLYPDALPEFRKEMDDNGWDYGEDDEELMELAMHAAQYRNYKSGKAKADFEKDLAEKKGAKAEKAAPAPAAATSGGFVPKTLNVDVNGEKFVVAVSYGDAAPAPTAAAAAPAAPVSTDDAEEIIAPLEGNYHRTKSASETAIKVGDTIREGDIIGYIESMKVYNAISADKSGKIVEICFNDGETVEEDDALIKLQ
jgi:pyruvate carboxylase subunit B